MPGTHSFAEIGYSLTDLIVAKYSKTEDLYETPIALADGQTMDVDPENDTDQLRGYGVKTALLSINVGAKITLGQGGMHTQALQAITGAVTNTSGTTPNRVVTINFPAGGAGLPYWGAIGVMATDDGGLIVVGLRAIKLDKYPKITLDGKENKFNVPESDGYAIPISSLCIREKRYETASDWTAPTTGADFKAFFTTPSL